MHGTCLHTGVQGWNWLICRVERRICSFLSCSEATKANMEKQGNQNPSDKSRGKHKGGTDVLEEEIPLPGCWNQAQVAVSAHT